MMTEKAINKMIASMYTEGILSEENEEKMRVYLDWMYQAGYEQGVHEFTVNKTRPVELCDEYGVMLKTFSNTKVAAEEAAYGRSTISKAIKSGRVTKRGHIWRYVSDEQNKDNS